MMTVQPAPTREWHQATLAAAEAKVIRLAGKVGPSFLHATVDGRYVNDRPEWWTSGFWPGMLWLVHARTGDAALARIARRAEDELERIVLDDRLYELHHDVGFQFMPTAVMRFKLTGAPSARRRGLLAAALLMARFNPAGSVLEAWNGDAKRGMSIIDTLMNLPLLFWAGEELGEPRFRNVAEAHLRTALTHSVREDGTTRHIVRFDQTTGTVVEVLGGQGYAPESVWSRGQSWAVYGLPLAYRYTQNPLYLDRARRVADSFIAAVPAGDVPPWDFLAPDAATAPRDSSAAATAASGLLELASLLPDAAAGDYRDAAVRLLRALNDRCATWDEDGQDGLLRRATGKLPMGENIEVSLIYGDFFFLEALYKLSGVTRTCW